MKRCKHCGRRGSRAFAWAYKRGWLCTNIDACAKRYERRTVRSHDGTRFGDCR